MSRSKKNVVTIGGGSGQYVLLKGLVSIPDIEITAIVSMADSGGSTGVLRDQYGILPPGDVLKCLLALSPFEEAREMLLTRFMTHPTLRDHNAGNLLLTFLTDYVGGSFPQAVEALSEILKVKGRVLPVTTDKATLVAELSTGERLFGEAAIDQPRGDRDGTIVHTYLVPHHGKLEVCIEVIEALGTADVIIIGPGDVYTSIAPNFLVDGVSQAINWNEQSLLIYIMNLMTKYGETHNFTCYDFIEAISKFIKRSLTHIVANTKPPSPALLHEYTKQRATFIDPPSHPDERFVLGAFLSEEGGIARHNSKMLRGMLETIIHGS